MASNNPGFIKTQPLSRSIEALKRDVAELEKAFYSGDTWDMRHTFEHMTTHIVDSTIALGQAMTREV